MSYNHAITLYSPFLITVTHGFEKGYDSIYVAEVYRDQADYERHSTQDEIVAGIIPGATPRYPLQGSIMADTLTHFDQPLDMNDPGTYPAMQGYSVSYFNPTYAKHILDSIEHATESYDTGVSPRVVKNYLNTEIIKSWNENPKQRLYWSQALNHVLEQGIVPHMSKVTLSESHADYTVAFVYKDKRYDIQLSYLIATLIYQGITDCKENTTDIRALHVLDILTLGATAYTGGVIVAHKNDRDYIADLLLSFTDAESTEKSTNTTNPKTNTAKES